MDIGIYRKSVSILIPVKNEEETIGKVLTEINEAIPNLLSKYDFRIIVIDGNSTDKTRDIIKKFNNVELIMQDKKKPGKGNGLIQAFQAVRSDIFVLMDGDFSHRAHDLHLLLDSIENGYGFVIASRGLGGSDEYTTMRTFGNVILTSTFSILFGVKLTDILNGYKSFRSDVVKGHNFTAGDLHIEVEILSVAIARKYSIKEIASHERERAGGEAKSRIFKHGFLILFEIIKQGIKYRLGILK